MHSRGINTNSQTELIRNTVRLFYICYEIQGNFINGQMREFSPKNKIDVKFNVQFSDPAISQY